MKLCDFFLYVTEKYILEVIMYAQTTEFDKYSMDFSNTLNSMKISNTVSPQFKTKNTG